MCLSPGWGGSRARINADRCRGRGRGSRGWLHVNATIEGSILIIGARISCCGVVSAGVKHGCDAEHPSATAEFVAGYADDGPGAV